MDLKTIAELQLFEQFPRDQQFLNFGCSFIHAKCPHIAIKPFHDMSGHNTVATVNLQCLIDDSVGRFRREQFCDRGFKRRIRSFSVMRAAAS
jgi:hypothetical protein